MTATIAPDHRSALEARAAEIVSAIFRRRDQLAVVPTADELERALSAVEREGASSQIDALVKELEHVNEAIFRCDAGDYGRCVTCDRQIPSARLAAVPWAPRCVQCQEREEGRR